VANTATEAPEELAATIERALRFVPPGLLCPCADCGMAALDRSLADEKLAAGAALVRGRARLK
jgi:5-methyltetrahydropteroyltriglutamate--homocysteine methyltransferase